MPYSSTGMFTELIMGRSKGLYWHFVLYYWLISKGMLRMASLSILVECKEQVSRVQRVSIVGLTDGSSLTSILMGA